ncbi:hypothetical protein H181DRAFT_01047 [Streptomyces sp. WMMB 714]|jgi:hypothetical protein|nr:hypothetical protein H181DRAFT_01047 [Streptomyces sp. WMMB 714]
MTTKPECVDAPGPLPGTEQRRPGPLPFRTDEDAR